MNVECAIRGYKVGYLPAARLRPAVTAQETKFPAHFPVAPTKLLSLALGMQVLEIPFLSQEEMYQAFARRDASYAGAFIVAVRTTGIFCRPGCTARTPKRENVVFYANTQQALCHGFRPCKVCHPMQTPGQTPDAIARLLAYIEEHPGQKVSDANLQALALQPATVKRWFLKHHGITFQAYHRLYRLNAAFRQIFTEDSFKATFHLPPAQARHQTLLDCTRFETPLGPMIAAAGKQGLYLLEFADRHGLDAQVIDLAKRLDATLTHRANPHLAQLRQEIAAYFEGGLKAFTVPLIMPGSAFRQRVWASLQAIPYGQTSSYNAQALALGQPEAIRAVARANGSNRLAIVIPCHRVIASGGELTGYAGGLWRKHGLLEHERKHG